MRRALIDCVRVARAVALRVSRATPFSYEQLLPRAAALSDKLNGNEEQVEKILRTACDAATKNHTSLACISDLLDTIEESAQ
jgi:hypothetical protein